MREAILKNGIQEVVIELTQECNLECMHCGSDCGSSPNKKELAVADWKKCLNELVDLGAKKVVFSGGEPTIKKGFEDLIRYANNTGIKYGFITNGFHLEKSLIDTISKCKPFAVGISMDGLKSVHNKIRKNKDSWSNLISVVSILKSVGIQICAVTTVNKINYGQLHQLAQWLHFAEIDSWQIQLAMPFGRMAKNDKLLINEEEFKDVCRMIVGFRAMYPALNIQAADCFGIAPAGMIRTNDWCGCTGGLCSLGIDAFGNVMPCLSLRVDQRCGNIKEKSLKDIWENSSGFDCNRKFDKEKVKGKCAKCELLSDCRGGCASQSMAYYGHFHEAPFCFYRSFKGSVKQKEA